MQRNSVYWSPLVNHVVGVVICWRRLGFGGLVHAADQEGNPDAYAVLTPRGGVNDPLNLICVSI